MLKSLLWIDCITRYGLFIITIDATNTNHHIKNVRNVYESIFTNPSIYLFAHHNETTDIIPPKTRSGIKASAEINSAVNNTCIFANIAITIIHSHIDNPLLIHNATTSKINTTTSINAVGLAAIAKLKNNHDNHM